MQLKYIIAALMVLCLLAAPATVQAEKSVIGCEICEWLVATAEGFVNKTKPQIEQELLQICAKLGPYEQICDQLVLMELPDIIDQIIAKEPPAIVCSQVKICNGSAMAVAAPKAENSGICNMCQLLVTQVENWVESNDTIMTLEKKLEQVCSVIPGQYSALCTYAVEQYLPIFIHQVEKQFPALTICQDVHLCSSAQAAPVVQQQQAAELCPICKAAVGFLKTKINNVDVNAVKQQLEFACSFFQVPDCQQIVDKAAQIAQDLQTEDAQTICSTVVDVCPKQQVVTFNPFKKFLEAKDSKYCPTCLQITKYLEDLIVSDITVNEIIKLADAGCARLGALESLCKKFVPLAVDELKKLLLEKLPPQKVCSTLKMCDAAELLKLALAPQAADGTMCLACEYVISVADNWLIANNTQQSVKNTLDKVCQEFVPSIYQSQCIALVNQYEAQLIQLFESKVFNPQTVCKAIGVCSSQKMNRIKVSKIKMN
uniref:Naegleriapore B pore-forming peptide n=3 Tax=Naegleria fowleri TaxID=5763 RepID=Q9BKM1_NAEFO|nr:naegleriapore B pore-forming peptide precursor [Naegleria fowleri]